MTLLGLAVAGTAGAVDVRDWGRKLAASQRFVVLPQFGSEAVLDKETQLVWQRNIEYAGRFLPSASLYCTRAKIGGRMGWRLPTISELTSLVDPDSSGAVKLPAGHPFRHSDGSQISPNTVLWSATFDRFSPQDPALPHGYRYYLLDVETGVPRTEGAMLDYQSLCVRGGEAVAAY